MMLQPPLLQDFTSGKTVENIRKLDAGVAPTSAADSVIVYWFCLVPLSTEVTGI
jgi:hypothetical protein